jgi:hypothetical protein
MNQMDGLAPDDYYESNGWSRAGRTDAFDGMHVHTIGIVKEIDETEEITRTLD